MRNFKKVIVFLSFIFMVLATAPFVSYAADGQQYTENLIPVMTSNETPNGYVGYSSYTDTDVSYIGWKAFDGDSSGGWGTGYDNGYLMYKFPSPQIITKYTIVSSYSSSGLPFPKNWTFEGHNGSNWVILDTQYNITNWSSGVKKEFEFINDTAYDRYRINVTSTNNTTSTIKLFIGELEMMGPATAQVSGPTNLTVTSGDTKDDLKWDAVEGATSYNIKRSTTAGGAYTTIATATATNFIDTGLTNGTTYYYVVSAVTSSGESSNSNEASVTPQAKAVLLKLVLEVNQEQQLSVHDDLTENMNITWTSSDATVATVDINGVVKALKSGNTLITCTNSDGSYIETVKIIVVKTIRLAVDLKIGKTCRLTVDDLSETIRVTWISGDTSVATVSNTGMVTAVGTGLVLITAIDEQGNEIDHIYMRVRA